jgi:hypothetical protein
LPSHCASEGVMIDPNEWAEIQEQMIELPKAFAKVRVAFKRTVGSSLHSRQIQVLV